MTRAVVLFAVLMSFMVTECPGAPAVEIVGKGVISTERNETFPCEDPATGDLWFSVYDSSFSEQTIMFAQRTESGWVAPGVAPFSGQWCDRAPRFSRDGSVLYFTSNRPRPRSGIAEDMNVWRVQRDGDGWSDPEMLDPPFNSRRDDIHAVPTTSALWFASTRPGSRGRCDIYRVTWGGELTHLDRTINDEFSQPDLWVNDNGDVMILVISSHPQGYGGDDLYLSRFDSAAWSAPVNLGPEVNSAEYEYGPSLSRDGKFLYFTSHRSGSADVYRIPMGVVLGESN